MAAEALATTLNRPLVKLDLSTVLSKWLGETEKQIGQVFDLAEAANAVLVLDEAESLLRQRSNSSGSGLSTGVAYMRPDLIVTVACWLQPPTALRISMRPSSEDLMTMPCFPSLTGQPEPNVGRHDR